MPDSEWDAYKAEIERVYMREDKSLKDLRQFMETTYGFCKTKYQYESQFKKWDFRKNRMGKKKWEFVRKQMEKNPERQHSEVYVDGLLLSPTRVKFEIHRQAFQTEIEKHYRAPSPVAPEGIIVCSPGPSAFQFVWPPSLPWFIFSKSALAGLQTATENSSLFSTRLGDVHERDASVQLINRGLVRALSSLLIGDQAKLLRTGRNSSRVAAALSLIMPEQHEGQNLYISECLSGLRGGSDAVERLRVAIFLVSNSFQIAESVQRHPGEEIDKEDKSLMALFHLSGLNTFQSVKHLLSLPGATSHAIGQKLFASAMRTHDVKTVSMVLKAGLNPDTLICQDGRSMSPLELVCGIKDSVVALQMCRLFLSHGAGSKDAGVLQRALCSAVRSENDEVVKAVLAQGVHISGQVLQDAIVMRTPSLLRRLVDVDCNVNKRSKGTTKTGYTALGVAVKQNNISLMKQLLGLGADVDALQEVACRDRYFRDTTVLGIAVNEGNDIIIKLLLAANANVNHEGTTDRYIPPIVLAVENGNKRATKLLLEAGVDFGIADAFEGKTLVQRALRRNYVNICRSLMAYGAKADARTMEHYYTSILHSHVQQRDLDTVILLLSWGARKDAIYYKVPETALGAAIDCGDCEIIKILLQAGAINTGRLLIQIGNLQTARYLEQVGLLSGILYRCGQPILVSAIRAESTRRGDGLVQYLLDLDVDRQPRAVGVEPFQVEIADHMSDKKSILLKAAISPLAKAISHKNLSLAKLLVERGAPVTDLELTVALANYRRQDRTKVEFLTFLLDTLSHNPCAVPNAFEEAMRHIDALSLVRRFLDIGLDPRGKVMASGSPGSIYLYQLHGTTQFKTLDSVLERAAIQRDGALLETLLRATTWTAIEKGRALTASLIAKHKVFAYDLLDAQANVNQELDDDFGKPVTPLLVAIQMQDVPLVRRLLAAGADLKRQRTILQSAIRTGNKHVVKTLLDAGADANSPASSVNGRTALQQATENGNCQLVDMLLDSGADVNQEPAEEGGATALQFAAIQGYIGIARKLLENGADVNAGKSRYYGRTALEGAAEHGRIDMLQLLLEEGASIGGDDRRQYIRAVKLAEKKAQHAAAKLLRDYGGWNDSDAKQYEQEDFDYYEKHSRRQT